MLKWTASASKMPQDTPVTHRVPAARVPRSTDAKRRKRRATIANKENIPILTSTPMVSRTRNSPLVLTPLADILNVTPETLVSPSGTPVERRRVTSEAVTANRQRNQRRHSTLGLTLPAAEVPKYATTLPKFEEEYSPNTVFTGQQLALRGLLPDPFMANRRYFTTPQVAEQEVKQIASQVSSSPQSALPQKRKLELDFLAIAQEEEEEEVAIIPVGRKEDMKNNTGILSNRMGDQTLDNLIDAILDSARKEEKKKKPRRSTFNLRRRTLMKNQVDTVTNDLILSPSYAAGDDPCSDLSFLGGEQKPFIRPMTPQPASPIVLAAPITPTPATPNPGVNFTASQLLQLPTPLQQGNKHQDSFNLATPPVANRNLKRRSNSKTCQNSSAKKYKVDSRNYFEVGLALPSIYV
ncbi:uncharacterized protein LOC133334476 [Musca vetustissima]|uniref:uncharacterized protein LOC133334476 n=1 Tax=Musca vetustissima TaxID=27455 RepID=UPI002AB774FF|nr:uncharacterized protein LOC133334476 [Musca vetustissima]